MLMGSGVCDWKLEGHGDDGEWSLCSLSDKRGTEYKLERLKLRVNHSRLNSVTG